jgi:hypothetical protein
MTIDRATLLCATEENELSSPDAVRRECVLWQLRLAPPAPYALQRKGGLFFLW